MITIRLLVLALTFWLTSWLALAQSQPTGSRENNAGNAAETQTVARVTDRAQPTYTKEARKYQVQGTVILRCIFRSSGKITDIAVIKSLPDGLTERAIKAAKKIKFKPAMKDGHPVSMWMQLEYNFNLY